MISLLRKIVSKGLYYSGTTRLHHKIKNRKVIILAYHRVLNLDNNFTSDSSLISASVDNFEKQMKFLSENYNVISLNEFVNCCKSKKQFKKNTVVITFDDGYEDVFTNAFPILKKYNLPATVYLSTGAIDSKNTFWWDKIAFMINKTKVQNVTINNFGDFDLTNKQLAINKINTKLKFVTETEKIKIIKTISSLLQVVPPKKSKYLTWNQINVMKKNKISFGAHTVNHPILTNISLKDAENEIVKSKKMIEKKLKNKVNLFAYPNGHSADFNDDIIKILKKNKFECATTYMPGWCNVNSDLFTLNRIFVKYDDDNILFFNKMNGTDIYMGKVNNLLNTLKRGK